MKVTLKVDPVLVPIIKQAIRDYADKSIAEMMPAETPAVVKAPQKKRGRPPGKRKVAVSSAAVAVSAPAAVAA